MFKLAQALKDHREAGSLNDHRFFLKDTGRKLAHSDRELNAGRTPMPPHLHRGELS